MALRLEPMTEEDLGTFVHIIESAFVKGISSYLMISPPTPETREQNRQRYIKAFNNDKTCRWAKVVDSTTSEMIAGAKWNFYTEERTEEEVKKGARRMDELPANANRATWEEFFSYMNNSRWDFMGTRPHAILGILATYPDHHRRGAASLLLQDGLKKADELGLEAYLEASPTGKPLYERFGFEVKQETEFNLTKYGGEGVDYHWVMIRPAQKLHSEEKSLHDV